MSMRKVAICSIWFVLATTAIAHGSTGEAHEMNWMNLAYRVITFVLFVGVLWHFFGKKAVGFLKNRTTSIADEISSLEDRKAAAQKQLQEIEQRIKSLDQDCQVIIDEYTKQGESIRESIIAQAEKTAEQIIAQAKASAVNDAELAIEEIREEIAQLVIERAEALLAEKLSPEEHTALIDSYLTKVVLN